MNVLSQKLGVALATTGIALAASATPATAQFFRATVRGFSENAILTLEFDGEDLNTDNILRFDELSSFAAEFSGNSVVPAFQLDSIANLLSDSDSQITSDFFFTVDLQSTIGGVAPRPLLLSFAACERPNALVDCTPGGLQAGQFFQANPFVLIQGTPPVADFADNPEFPDQISIVVPFEGPASWLILATGGVILGGRTLARHRQRSLKQS